MPDTFGDLINKSKICFLTLRKDSDLNTLLWFGGDTFTGYTKDGKELGTWPADARQDGVVTKRTVLRSMNRISSEYE